MTTILLAEDNPTNAKVLLMLLEHLGLTATLVKNGYDAVELVESLNFDLVLMDIDMPGITGIEACRRIFKRVLDRTPPKIIAVTSMDKPEIRDACMDVGMCDFLTKPLTLTALQESLACHLPGITSTKREDLTERPLIDVKLLDSLIRIDKTGECQSLIQEFAQEVPDLLEGIQSAMKQPSTLRQRAHAFRGSASVFGLNELARQLTDLEEMASRSEVAPAEHWLPALTQCAKASTRDLQVYLSSLTPQRKTG